MSEVEQTPIKLDDKQVCILMYGLPSAGKDTWAKTQMDNNPGKYKRVNTTDLIEMMDNGEYLGRDNEEYMLLARNTLAHEALGDGKSIIITDCNLPFGGDHFRTIASLFLSAHHATGKEMYFLEVFVPTDPVECIRRNANRFKTIDENRIKDLFLNCIIGSAYFDSSEFNDGAQVYIRISTPQQLIEALDDAYSPGEILVTSQATN